MKLMTERPAEGFSEVLEEGNDVFHVVTIKNEIIVSSVSGVSEAGDDVRIFDANI